MTAKPGLVYEADESVLHFKLLMYNGKIVDRRLLSEGIYSTDRPDLLPADETLESLIEKQEKVLQHNDYLLHTVNARIENIKKCRLVDVELVISTEVEKSSNDL